MQSDRARQQHGWTARWIAAGYWWYFAGLGTFLPYIALYYRQLGLSGAEIGVLSAVSPLGVALFAPAWGALADAFGIHRQLLQVSLVLSAAIVFALPAASSFASLLLLIGALALFSAPTPALLDSYSVIVAERQGIGYGQLRVWGSIGYSGMSWFVGWWMGQNVSSLFLLWYGAALLLACVSTLKLPPLPVPPRAALWRDAAVVARQPAVFVLLLTTFLVSCSTSIFYTYFGIYLAGMGATAGLVGTATAIAGLSELPVLFFGAWLMQRFGSRRLILLALTLYSIRFGLYMVLPSAGWALPIQLVHGLTYGAYLMASVSLAHKLVPLELAATAQGLLTAMALGFGMIAGALLGGALLDAIGIAPLFGLAALIMLAALVVFLVGFRFPAGSSSPDVAAVK